MDITDGARSEFFLSFVCVCDRGGGSLGPLARGGAFFYFRRHVAAGCREALLPPALLPSPEAAMPLRAARCRLLWALLVALQACGRPRRRGPCCRGGWRGSGQASPLAPPTRGVAVPRCGTAPCCSAPAQSARQFWGKFIRWPDLGVVPPPRGVPHRDGWVGGPPRVFKVFWLMGGADFLMLRHRC